ncbi:hypothetical protein HMPREF0044_0438 [Gleimia coleocanis DSM 15436]|uniref:Uncharacterized protein n=1 Tax=Gleimia coleocanis DSM 15436 TaxID=525245 RepID=C0VZ48_9ACTO|nr:hypothetical protein HMPREF0044_0438 [Gleimia coleocanis DSM 15436]
MDFYLEKQGLRKERFFKRFFFPEGGKNRICENLANFKFSLLYCGFYVFPK